jgi:hypothetical protein
VQSLHIQSRASQCIVTFASIAHQQASMGTTVPIIVTPVIVTDHLTHGQPLSPHAFEILDLDQDEYQFIIGIDLIPLIFGDAIPVTIACRHSPSLCIHTATVHITPPTSSLIHTSIPAQPSRIMPMDQQELISSLEGQGYIPVEERPARVTTSTPADLEQEYNIRRNEVLHMTHIQQALQQNESITGFCNIPEATLKLTLDPQRGTPALHYSMRGNILLVSVQLTLQIQLYNAGWKRAR